MLVKKRVIQSLGAALALSMGGCGLFFGEDGVFRDRGDDYLKAQSVEPIKIPSDSQGERIGQLFVIPEAGNVGGHAATEFTVPKPGSPETLAERTDQIKIQKLVEHRWIDISRPPAEVWPTVRDFLSAQGIAVVDQNSATGTLETGWVSAQANGVDDRYRIQLENGLSPRSTEIQVVQMSGQKMAAREYAAWPERSVDPDREAWMLKELASYLANHVGSQASMLAQGIANKAPRVNLVQTPEPALLMQVDHARAWASVSGALNTEGYRVDSANREQGQWLISVSPPSKEEKDAEKAAMNYRVLLQRLSDGKMQVTVRSHEGEILPDSEADTLLRHIWDHLL